VNPAALLPSIRITQTWLLTIVDILLVWYVLYRVILLAKGRRAWPILIGLGIFFLLLLTAERLGLITLAWILRQFVPLGPVAIVILFYPELRDVLERLGRWEFWGGNYVPTKTTESIETVDNVAAAASMLSARKTGAIILISRETPLEDVASTGTRLDANVNSALLNTIFEHGTPLHDGAVIIHRGRILAAGCTLQISDAPNIGANVHMRHRAAIGASEQSDAIVVVVSEETGTISIAESGRLVRGLSQDALRVRLMERLGIQRPPTRKPWSRNGKGVAR